MFTLDKKALQLDDLLDKMAEKIQLDATRYDRMIKSYEAIKDWIEADQVFFKPYKYDVYPHGSVRILTTVKPFGSDEFDLDIAIHLISNTPHTPQKIYDELKRRLGENATYKSKMILKNRCIRINYEGDYHVDILPGIQETMVDNNKIKVPDRELGHWVSSNPRGYADWFITKANSVKQSLLEKAMRAENLPKDNFRNKKPLQRAVQLIKRYRDIYFQNDDTYKTSSIILTTIAGHMYKGEESIFNTIDNIVDTLRTRLNAAGERLKIVNPVNPAEDFTDKWDDQNYYQAFKQFIVHLYNEWQKLKLEHGVSTEGLVLKGLFGNDLFTEAQKQQALPIEGMRRDKSLGAARSSGILTFASSFGAASMKSNTFFGGDGK